MLGKTLESPLDCKRSNQLILKVISPEYSLEGLMLRLKLQYFGHLMQKTDSFEKTLMLARLKAGGEGDDRGWDGWITSPTRWTWVWVNSKSWWWTGRSGVLQSMRSQRVWHDWVTELNWLFKKIFFKVPNRSKHCVPLPVVFLTKLTYPKSPSLHVFPFFSQWFLADFCDFKSFKSLECLGDRDGRRMGLNFLPLLVKPPE